MTIETIIKDIEENKRISADEAFLLYQHLSRGKLFQHRKKKDLFQKLKEEAKLSTLPETIFIKETKISSDADPIETLNQKNFYTHISFDLSLPLENILETIRTASQTSGFVFFSPTEILKFSDRYSLRLTDLCKKIAFAGANLFLGEIASFDEQHVDECFGIISLLGKYGVNSLATVPSVKTDPKELFTCFYKMREFHDRTRFISHLALEKSSDLKHDEMLSLLADLMFRKCIPFSFYESG